MKCVILAGGTGTRLTEETTVKPKPMVEIGGMPIIWHIMKIYSHYGIKEFIVLCGYKGEIIKNYFINYNMKFLDLKIETSKNKIRFLNKIKDNWKITFLETGKNSMTGGRLKFVKKLLKKNETFCMTYGDGVSNINIQNLIKFHKRHKKLATVSLVQPFGRWGKVKIKKDQVYDFNEKPKGDGSWVSGGFFVLQKEALSILKNKDDVWELEPINNLVKKKQLVGYKHTGFWKAMDTINDRNYLEKMWEDKPLWKIWKDH